jgi:hypothetical protein
MSEVVTINYIVSRGNEAGTVLEPHKHKCGRYVASMSRFKKDYVRVESLRELAILSQHGFSVRMSSPDSENHRAPSLISPDSLKIVYSEVAASA